MKPVVLSFALGILSLCSNAHLLALEDAPANAPANGSAAARSILQLIQAQKADEAEAEFQRALKEFPESADVKNLRLQMYSLMLRRQKPAQALEHASALLNDQLAVFNQEPEKANSLAGIVNIVGAALHANGKTDEALERYDQTIELVASKIKEGGAPALSMQLDQLQLFKLRSLLEWGRGAAGEPLLQTQLAEVNQAFAETPDELMAAMRVVSFRQMELQYAVRLHPESVNTLRTELQKFLVAQIQKHPDQGTLIGHYNTVMQMGASLIASTDPVAAQKIIVEWKEFLNNVNPSVPGVKHMVKLGQDAANGLEQRLAADLKRLELIGKPAFALEAQDWVNGAALTADDLKGKVVLLDFWAVWCGPCIATFPHLREWHEKFSEKGLVIVGMTHYYEYDWDDDVKRPKASKGLAPEKEQEAMVKFAAHHQLQHRFAVNPKGSPFDRQYGVTGIPQAVLIDRAGNIRMIRVGSGDKNARDLEQMLEQLIAE